MRSRYGTRSARNGDLNVESNGMHEMAIALRIADMVNGEMAQYDGETLGGVGVKVGLMSGVDPYTLTFCLKTILRDDYGDVRIDVDEEPVQLKCARCQSVFSPHGLDMRCRECGTGGAEFLSGQALELERITLQ